MGEYAAIEKEAKLFTELCVHNLSLIHISEPTRH